jgi:hypothetical protein
METNKPFLFFAGYNFTGMSITSNYIQSHSNLHTFRPSRHPRKHRSECSQVLSTDIPNISFPRRLSSPRRRSPICSLFKPEADNSHPSLLSTTTYLSDGEIERNKKKEIQKWTGAGNETREDDARSPSPTASPSGRTPPLRLAGATRCYGCEGDEDGG